MKKTNILLLSTLVVGLLGTVSCGVQTTEKVDPDATIKAALAAAKEGTVEVLGNFNKKTELLNPIFNDNSNNSFTFNTIFEPNAYGFYSNKIVNGEPKPAESVAKFKNQAGYVTEDRVTGENQLYQFEVLREQKRILFDSEFSNPFSLLHVSDFTKVSEDVYTLDGTLAQQFVSRLLNNHYEGGTIEFTLGNNEFISFVATGFETTDFAQTMNNYAQRHVTLLDFVGEFLTKSETTVQHMSPLTSTPDENKLKTDAMNFISKIGSSNKVTIDTVDLKKDGSLDQVKSRAWFDGTNIYLSGMYAMKDPVQGFGNIPFMLDFLFVPNAEGTMDLYEYVMDLNTFEGKWTAYDPTVKDTFSAYYPTKKTYDQLLGEFSKTNQDVLQTWGTTNTVNFSIKKEALEHYGQTAIPGLYSALGLDEGSYDFLYFTGDSWTFKFDNTFTSLILSGKGLNQLGPVVTASVSVDFQFSEVGTSAIPADLLVGSPAQTK